ncbi:MAG: alpha/beta fold hydrolase [Alphaproteobacteria bacterium]|nr:alpha/beta fold hydrolase [Alphaproteobacteria bacterium]
MRLHATEAGVGTPVALLHGLFGAGQNFGTVQRRLSARFRVIALDLRNHGSSPHDPSMSYPEMAGDVIETLHALDALPAALIGHSMGGKVAMRAALDAPARVSRLVVADIAPVAYPPSLRPLAAAMRALGLEPGLTRAEADAGLEAVVPDAPVRAFLLQNLRLGAAPGWRIGLAAIEAALPELEGWAAPEAAQYRGPTLFVAGARSDYIRPEYRGLIHALFPAARFATIKGAGHWVHAENPTAFVSVLESFLA